MDNAPSTILVVDDDPILRDALGELLTEEGYDVILIGEGSQVLQKASQVGPDLIMLDVMMPDIDGFEICRRLRADAILAEVPIILVTSLADRESRLKGFKAGADDYITKPIDQTELMARVRTTTRLNRYRRLLQEQSRRQMAEEALDISEKRYYNLFNRIPIGLYRTTPDGTLLEANATLSAILGYPDMASLFKTNIANMYVNPEQRQRWQVLLEKKETLQNFETQLKRSDGTTVWVRDSARMVHDENADVLYYEGAIEDITAQKQMEQLLQGLNVAAQAMQEALTSDEIFDRMSSQLKALGLSCAVFLINEDQRTLSPRYMSYNPAVLQTVEEMTGMNAKQVSIPIQAVAEYTNAIENRDTSFVSDSRGFIRRILPESPEQLTDDVIEMLDAPRAIIAPLIAEERIIGMLSVHSDDLRESNKPAITMFAHQLAGAWHRAQLYEQIATERDRAQRYLDIAGVMLVALDAKGRITLINRKGCDILGCSEGDMLGKNWFDQCLPAEVRETVKGIFEQLMAGQTESAAHRENWVVTRSGERRLIDWYNTPLRDESGEIMGTLSSGEDITERRRAEEALRESEQTARALLDATTDIALLIAPQGTVLAASEMAAQMAGVSIDQFVESNVNEYLPPDQIELLSTKIKQVTQTGAAVRFQSTWQKATFDVRISPIFAAGDAPKRFAIFAHDITDQIKAHQAIEQRNRELSALNEISQTIVSSLDLQETLTMIAEYATRLMGMAATSVILRDEASDDLYFATASGEGADFVVGKRLPPGQGVVGWVIENGTPALIPDVSKDPRWYSEFDEQGGFVTHSILCVPLKRKEHTIGALEAINKQGNFSLNDLRLLNALAGPIATAIENARLFEQVQTGRRQLQALSRRLVEVQEAERSHVARELHDETGQALSAMLLSLSLLEQEVDDPEAITSRAVALEAMVDEMLENLHRLAMNLRPATLDHLGLVPALEQYVETFEQQYAITTRFKTVDIGQERLPPEVETVLYRIVQESLTNIARHAQATQADVLLKRRGDRVLTIVEDDGVGFDAAAAMRSSRLGLLGMRERAEMLGGTLTIESSEGVGTTIFVEVPYDAPPPGA